MTPVGQILWGTCLLGWSVALHVVVVSLSIPVLQRLGRCRLLAERLNLRIMSVFLASVIGLLAAHTVQIWSWSLAFLWMEVFQDTSASFYFATVTYTTLGYGDIVLGASARIFATFAAVAGLFSFGISTAFLIGLLGKLLPDVFT